MDSRIFIISFILLPVSALAQYHLSGIVSGGKNKGMPGAFVYLKNSLDGITTDSTGRFTFETAESGLQLLVVTYQGEKKDSLSLDIRRNLSGLHLLVTKTKYLNPVTVSASYEVSNSKQTALKPMDIMSTAGAGSDISKAIETLPGVQIPGSQTGLFVRGGDAAETSIVMDGMRLQNAFFSSLPGVSQSTRFSPFQFKGIAFNSGAYSARYGQALSSILELNTNDGYEKNQISLGTNMTGLFVSGDRVYKKSSLGFSSYFNDFKLFYQLAHSNVNFYRAPDGAGFSLNYIFRPRENSILKVFASTAGYTAGMVTLDPFLENDTVNFRLSSRTVLSTISYKVLIRDKWSVFSSFSQSLNVENSGWLGSRIGSIPLLDSDYRLQQRTEIVRYFKNSGKIIIGTESQWYGFAKHFDTLAGKFSEALYATYAEVEFRPLFWLAARPGLRWELSRILNQQVLEPRFSIAAKMNEYVQVTLAAGTFSQEAGDRYLLSGARPQMEKAYHYINTWEWTQNGYTLRLEGYYKKYADLIRTPNTVFNPNQFPILTPGVIVTGSGSGYARGAELFLRDKQSFKNIDYWISYSYIDTKRLSGDFPLAATPAFISKNSLNLVAKYFNPKWQTSFSLTYSFGSGRPYYDPSSTGFMTLHTPAISDISFAFGKLARIKGWFSVFYLGISNLTDRHDIFGYRYSADGLKKYPILPAVYRSVILGCNFSLSQFKKDEL